MPIPVPCQCGRTLNAPVGAAGRKVRCPHCKAVLDVPIPDLEEDDGEDFNPFVKAPTHAGPVIVQSTPSLKARPIAIPPEPWYYRFIAFFFGLLSFLGVLQFGITIYFISTTSITPDFEVVERVKWIIASSFLMLATWCSTAPMLLILDQARNVRAVRYRR